MDEIDFNVENYDLDELVQLLQFDNVPTNEDMIVHKITRLKQKYKNRPKYIKFFNEIGKKLIENFELFNKQTWQESYELDDSLSSKVLTQQYLNEEEDSNKNLILDSKKNIIGIKKVSREKSYATKETTQGVRNPVTINKITRIVNFDSQYREILNPISDSRCVGEFGYFTFDKLNPEIRLFQPTNYTVNLNQPLTNVVDISLESVEIPNTWYVFSSDYGTNALEFTYIEKDLSKVADIKIPELQSNHVLTIETVRPPRPPYRRYWWYWWRRRRGLDQQRNINDPEIGIKKAFVSNKPSNIVWESGNYNDDGGPGLHSKLTFTAGELQENTVYELWVGEYNTQFTNGQNPTVNYPSEVGNKWKVRFKVRDTSGNKVEGFDDVIIDGVIPSNGVGLSQSFIINYEPPVTPYKTLKIEIDDGNYTPIELMDTLNTECNLNLIPVEFYYNPVNGKVTMENLNNKYETTVKFYIEDSESSGCAAQKTFGEDGSKTPSPGNKIGYNLGWLLGYRLKTIVLSPSQKARAPSILDTFGPKYFLLTLDDFNNNKPNKDLISLVDNATKNFKLPNYYNSQTMNNRYGEGKYYPGKTANDDDGWKCQDIAGPPADRGCAENDLNIDLVSNLTKKQQYTVEQLTLANNTGTVDFLDTNTYQKSKISTIVNRYTSPNSSDLLARIPISKGRQDYRNAIVYKNKHPQYNKRVYFGPVKLRKFKVRLLNDKGFEVNLNEQDWSFSIYVTSLYQF